LETPVKNPPLNNIQRMGQTPCTATTTARPATTTERPAITTERPVTTTTSRQSNGSTKNQNLTFVSLLGLSVISLLWI